MTSDRVRLLFRGVLHPDKLIKTPEDIDPDFYTLIAVRTPVRRKYKRSHFEIDLLTRDRFKALCKDFVCNYDQMLIKLMNLGELNRDLLKWM